MSILARLRARCAGPGGEYQVSGDDLDALLLLTEACAEVEAANWSDNLSRLSEALDRRFCALDRVVAPPGAPNRQIPTWLMDMDELARRGGGGGGE